jgi:hypothetical protein
MLRSKMNGVLTVLATLALVLSIASHTTTAKDAKSTVTPVVKSDVKLLNSAKLGSSDLKPGDYSVTADDTHAKFSKGGKVIAEVSIQWKDESSKAKYTTVVVESSQIKEIHFSGKMKYVEITQ